MRSRGPSPLVAIAALLRATASTNGAFSAGILGSGIPMRHPPGAGDFPQHRRSPPMLSAIPSRVGAARRAASIAASTMYPLATASSDSATADDSSTQRLVGSRLIVEACTAASVCSIATGSGSVSVDHSRNIRPMRPSNAPIEMFRHVSLSCRTERRSALTVDWRVRSSSDISLSLWRWLNIWFSRSISARATSAANFALA